MGHESFRRLPYISSYQEAKSWLERIEPIRKSKQLQYDIYPLAERRDSRKFAIRMADDDASNPQTVWYERCPNRMDGDIELLLYASPIVTFHADNTVTLFPGSRFAWSSSDTVFIEETLGRYVYSASTSRKRLVLKMHNGDVVVVEPKEAIRLTLNQAARTMKPVNNELPTVIRMNRAKANAVRKRYGEFYRYLKGMIGLRKEPHTTRYHNYQTGEDVYDTQYVVRIPEQEMRDVVGFVVKTVQRGGFGPANHYEEFTFIYPAQNKPAKCVRTAHWDSTTLKWGWKEDRVAYTKWEKSARDFIALIEPLKEGEDFDRYYRAFVMLVYFVRMPGNPQDCEVDSELLSKTADRILFSYFSDEVFYRATAEPGRVPSLKYDKWVTRDMEDSR